MKRIILILTLLLPTAFSAFAQIENEIEQSKKEKIAKVDDKKIIKYCEVVKFSERLNFV